MMMNNKYKTMAYKLWWEDDPYNFYVGGTHEKKLSGRMANHRAIARRGNKALIYQIMREKGINDFKYVMLGSKMVTCKEEENKFEQEWIDREKPTLNSQRAHGFDKERFKAYQKEYNQRPDVRQRRRDNYDPVKQKQHYNYKHQFIYCKYCCTCLSNTASLKRHENTKTHIHNFILY